MSSECGIKVDAEGNWFYEDRPIIRKDIIELFYENLEYDPENGFWIKWHGERCKLDVEDTPFIITRVDRVRDGSFEKILAHFKHLKRSEELDLSTLFADKNNVLHCRIKNGEVPARFSRPAYYQLAAWVEEDDKGFFIKLNDKKYYIQ